MAKTKLKDADELAYKNASPKKGDKNVKPNITTIERIKRENEGKDIAVLAAEARQRPLHSLLAGYQHESVLILIDLMKNAKSEAVKRQSALDILSLGGNSSRILEMQVLISGKNKDVSQMSVNELESFVELAKTSLVDKMLKASELATVVEHDDTQQVGDNPTGGGDNEHVGDGQGVL